jgi:hypothetical protein
LAALVVVRYPPAGRPTTTRAAIGPNRLQGDDVEPTVDLSGEPVHVSLVTGHDCVASLKGASNDASVNNVAALRVAHQLAGYPSRELIQLLYHATIEDSRK